MKMERVTHFSLPSYIGKTGVNLWVKAVAAVQATPPPHHSSMMNIEWCIWIRIPVQMFVTNKFAKLLIALLQENMKKPFSTCKQDLPCFVIIFYFTFLNLAFRCGLRNLTHPPFFLLIQTLFLPFIQHDNTKILRRLSLTVCVGPAQLFLFFM